MKKPPCSPPGFSLIELLVSLAVVAVLAVIVTMSAGQIRRYSDSAACASNLRQIGAAVLAYSADHQMTMPGPMSGGVSVVASEWGMRPSNLTNLTNFLAPYFGVSDLPNGAVVPMAVMSCRAAGRVIRERYPDFDENNAQHYIHLATSVAPGVTERGFGYYGSGRVQAVPFRINQFRDLSKSVALVERDNALLGLFGDVAPNRPEHAVHGSTRNALFFDGHVEAIAVERFKARDRGIEID